MQVIDLDMAESAIESLLGLEPELNVDRDPRVGS
jgi:hypothetical protein